MGGARWTAVVVAAVVVVVVVVAGCGSSSRVTVRELAIAAPGHAGDIGWNQQGIAAARTVARRAGIRVTVAQGVGEGDPSAALTRLAKGGAGLVIAHGRGFAAAASAVAAKTNVPELVFGSPGRLKPGRVGDVEVATQEGGYLAGYISARASYVRAVGIVVAGDDPSWYRTAGGFIAGARKFDPHVRILYTHLPGAAAGDDAQASQLAAEAQIRHRTQMVLGLGERSTFGVMAATMNALRARGEPKFDAMFVDVIGDKSGSGHRALSGLTAVIWNFQPAYRRALADLRTGTYGTHPYTLDLANGGVSVIADGRTPEDNYRAALGLGRQIVRGQITVPVTTTNEQVLELLRQKPA